jgi:hypothetical protein
LPVASTAAHLQPGAEAGVDADHGPRAEGRGQEQRAQVAGEHRRGLLIALRLALRAHVVLDRRRQQATVALADRAGQEVGPRRARGVASQAEHAGDDAVGAAVGLDGRAQHALGLAAPDREEAVRRDGRDRLAEGVVGLVLGRLGDLVGHALGHHRAGGEGGAGQGSDVGAIGHHLGDDVAGAGQGLLDRADLAPDQRRRLSGRIAVARLGQDALGQGPEATLAGGAGAGLALGPVRRVEVLELGLGGRGLQARGQGVGQDAGGGQLGADRGAPSLALGQVGVALLDRAELDLVEPAGLLFAIASDERHGGAVAEQGQGGGHLGRRQGQLTGEFGDEIRRGRCGHGEGART